MANSARDALENALYDICRIAGIDPPTPSEPIVGSSGVILPDGVSRVIVKNQTDVPLKVYPNESETIEPGATWNTPTRAESNWVVKEPGVRVLTGTSFEMRISADRERNHVYMAGGRVAGPFDNIRDAENFVTDYSNDNRETLVAFGFINQE